MANPGVLISDVLVEVKHPAWTPVSAGGESPVVGGSATFPTAGAYQPIAVGSSAYRHGGATDYIEYSSDSGLMITISPYSVEDMIEDHTGDGDNVQQLRSHHFTTPGERTIEFDWTARGKYLSEFFWTAYLDATKRALTMRETYLDVAAVTTNIAVNKSTGGAVGDTSIPIDGTSAGDLEVEDLIQFTGNARIFRVTVASSTSISFTPGLNATVADDVVITRAAVKKQLETTYLVGNITDKREAKGVQGCTVTLRPDGQVVTMTGMSQ